MKKINGWRLPSKDGYFIKFTGATDTPSKGTPSKSNGFQKDHLVLAFKEVREWDVAIDVGAHVGFWTHDMAQRFKHVFAFEPASDTFECLEHNMAEHRNVTLINAACGAAAGECTVAEDPGQEGNTGSRFVQKGIGTKMCRLDDLPFETVDLIKIDVEGFEISVLEGAKATIKAFHPVIIMETDKKFPGRYKLAMSSRDYLISRHGYREVSYEVDDPHRPGRKRNRIRPDRIFVPSNV